MASRSSRRVKRARPMSLSLASVRGAVREEIATVVPECFRSEFLRIGLAVKTDHDALEAAADFRYMRDLRKAAASAKAFAGQSVVDLLVRVAGTLLILGAGVAVGHFMH